MSYTCLLSLLLAVHSLAGIRPLAAQSWTKHYPSKHGLVTDLAVDTNNAVFACGHVGGIFKSTDDGRTWSRMPFYLSSGYDRVFVPFPGIVYAFSDSIYASRDGGRTWSTKSKDGSPAFRGSPSRVGSRLYDVVKIPYPEVYYSDDTGQTWVKTEYQQFPGTVFGTVDGGLIGILDGYVIRSSDEGATWSRSYPANLNWTYPKLHVTREGVVLLRQWDARFHLYARSTDGGITWTESSISDDRFGSLTNFVESPEGDLYVIGSSRLSDSLYQGEIYISKDQGGSWKLHSINSGYSPNPVPPKGVAVVFTGTSWIGGYSTSTLMRSTDTMRTWKECSEGYTGIDVFNSFSSRHGFLLANAGGFFRCARGETMWTPVTYKDEQLYGIHGLVDLADRAVIAKSSHFLESLDSGLTWTLRGDAPAEGVLSFRADAMGRWYAGCSEELYISSDNGANWTRSVGEIGQVIDQLGVFNNGDLIRDERHNLWISSDLGESWQIVTEFRGLDSWALSKNDELYVFDDDYLHVGVRGVDGTFAWTKRTGQLTNHRTGVVVDSVGRAYRIDAAISPKERGISMSTDRGATWKKITTDTMTVYYEEMIVDHLNRLLVTTWNDGLYEWEPPAIAKVAHKHELDGPPNLVVDGDLILDLKHNASAITTLADVSGRLVLEQRLSSGLNVVSLAGYPRGVYLVTLKSEGKVLFTQSIRLY